MPIRVFLSHLRQHLLVAFLVGLGLPIAATPPAAFSAETPAATKADSRPPPEATRSDSATGTRSAPSAPTEAEAAKRRAAAGAAKPSDPKATDARSRDPRDSDPPRSDPTGGEAKPGAVGVDAPRSDPADVGTARTEADSRDAAKFTGDAGAAGPKPSTSVGGADAAKPGEASRSDRESTRESSATGASNPADAPLPRDGSTNDTATPTTETAPDAGDTAKATGDTAKATGDAAKATGGATDASGDRGAGQATATDAAAETKGAAADGGESKAATAAPPPEPMPRGVVVLLPLQQEAFAKAADAVRRGFLAGAEVDKATDAISVIAYADGGLDGALEAARFAQPEWIVGPLTRDDVNRLVRQAEPLPPVLALNQPDDPSLLPPQVYTFSLAVEAEARQAAAQMRADGVASAAVLTGRGLLQRRVAAAFEAEWRERQGALAGRFGVGAGLADSASAKRLREAVLKSNAEAVFLALDAEEAQRVRPALGPVRLYATSQVYDGQDETLLRDLDGVRFFGMPWVVEPTSDVCAPYPRDGGNVAALERLYAFGIDAYRLIAALRVDPEREKVAIDGVTGRIALAGPNQFARGGVLTEIRNGRLVPLDVR